MADKKDDATKIISWKKVKERVPYTRQHCGRLEKQNKFPRRVRVGENRVGWVEAEIEAFLQGLIAERGT